MEEKKRRQKMLNIRDSHIPFHKCVYIKKPKPSKQGQYASMILSLFQNNPLHYGAGIEEEDEKKIGFLPMPFPNCIASVSINQLPGLMVQFDHKWYGMLRTIERLQNYVIESHCLLRIEISLG